jgi:hypothetical protein
MDAVRPDDPWRVAPDLVRRPLIAAVLLLVAACGDDDDEAVVTTTTTVAPTTVTTAAPSTATTCPPGDDAGVVSRVDHDGDGVDEVWRSAGSGAATDIVELRRVVDCAEVAVTLDGFPAQFAIGGSVLLLNGLRCADGRVVHLGATSEDGENYTTLDIAYELQDGELVRVDDASGQLTTADPAFADYTRFDC